MDTKESQITSLMIVYSTVYSGTDERKYQSSMLLAFVRGIHRSLEPPFHYNTPYICGIQLNSTDSVIVSNS